VRGPEITIERHGTVALLVTHGRSRRSASDPGPCLTSVGQGPAVEGKDLRCDDRQALAARAAARSKGSLRSLTPVAMRTALATAGAIGGSPGSPTPLGGFVDGTM